MKLFLNNLEVPPIIPSGWGNVTRDETVVRMSIYLQNNVEKSGQSHSTLVRHSNTL